MRVYFGILLAYFVLAPCAHSSELLDNTWQNKLKITNAHNSLNNIFYPFYEFNCIKTNTQSIECKKLIQDSFAFAEIEEAFFYENPRSILSINWTKLASAISKVKVVSECIKIRCIQYKQVSKTFTKNISNDLSGAISLLECIQSLDKTSFRTQNLAAWNAIYSSSRNYNSKNVMRHSYLSKLYPWAEPYLFLNNTTFMECSNLELSESALRLLVKISPKSPSSTF